MKHYTREEAHPSEVFGEVGLSVYNHISTVMECATLAATIEVL